MYLRGLLADCGIGNNETSPGEDYSAIDLWAYLPSGVVGVQVKAGRQRLNRDETYSVSVTEAWCQKWAGQNLPIFLVYVALSGRDDLLITHHAKSTTWKAHAYWHRVNDASPGTVRVPMQNRVNQATFQDWEKLIRQDFTRGAA